MSDPDAAGTGRLPGRLGRYQVQEVLGTGAFATVYRARDERLETDVAVKVLAENHAFDPDRRERFILEGRLLRRVASPHVIDVHDLGETDAAQPFLVLELADRGDLRHRADEARAAGWTPTADDVITLCRALASAMEVLHTAEVVHRDLAPGNLLLVSPDGAPRPSDRRLVAADERVVVADLGLSKDLAKASGLTVGTGTTGFTPPEQREAGGWVDARADIWSASALLLWLLTSRTPTEQEPARWEAQLAEHGWPPALATALRAGLDDDPEGRPRHAAAWRDSIIDTVRPTAPVPVTRSDAGPDRAPKAGRRRVGWGLAAAIAAVALVLGGAAGWLLHRPSDDRVEVGERTDLDGGRVRYRARSGDGVLAVTGPRSVPVGQTATLTLSEQGITEWHWFSQRDGVKTGRTITVTPTTAGTATVILIGTTDTGDLVEIRYRLQAR